MRASSPSFALLTLTALFAGCAKIPPDDAGERIAAVAQLGEPIRFTAAGGALDADDAIDGAALSLADAASRALRNDPQVQASLARVRIALADAKQARLLPNPVLDVVLRFPEGGGKTQVEAGLSADLLSVLSMPRRAGAADKRLRAASEEALVTALDVLAGVEERYATVQALDAELAVFDERGKLLRQLLDLSKSRLEAGEASRLDVLALDAQRAEAEIERLELLGQRTQERLTLARLIGQPSSPADWQLDGLGDVTAVGTDEQAWIHDALRHRPDVQSRRWELAALGDDAALASWPWSDGGGVGVEAERDEETWAIGPSISAVLPLFDWGQARREKASAQVAEARHRLTQARREAVEDVRRAIASLASTRAALAMVRDELLPLAQRRHEQAEAQYRAGESDVTTLIAAERELLSAQSRLVRARKDASLAVSRLHRAVGGAAIAEELTKP